jgi:hypothetical protein
MMCRMRGMLSPDGEFEQRRYRIATVKNAGRCSMGRYHHCDQGLPLSVAASRRLRLQMKRISTFSRIT